MDEPVTAPPEVRRWTRRSTDRWFAGVAGGVADGLRVDPWVVRLGFVAATAIGGVGVLVYLFCWWLLPRRDLPDSAAQRMSRRFPGAPTWLGVGLLVVGVMLFAGQLGWWRPSLVFAFLLIGLGVLLFRGQMAEETLETAGGPASTETGPPDPTGEIRPPDPFLPTQLLPTLERPAAPSPPQEARERWFLGLVGAALGLGLLAMVRLMQLGRLNDVGSGVGLLILAGILLVVGLVVRGRRPAERGRSFLSLLTIGLALLALGTAALLDLVGAISLMVGGGFALVLLFLGAGLCVGAWYGRARWLIFLAIVLAPLALLATVITIPLDQGFGDHSFTVTRADQLPASYAIAGGTLWLDLTKLPPGTVPAAITAEVGAGTLHILVPSDADVVVTGDVGVGQYTVSTVRQRRYYSIATNQHSRGGVDLTIDDAIQGAGDARPITLSVHASAGEIRIDRVVNPS
jgi:phage shock protein PspC (stress-responsive transcriptional regulator)